MGYEFKSKEAVPAGVRRIALEQIDQAMGRLLDPGERPDVAVHEARKHLKKTRALLRLVRKELGEDLFRRENRCLRDAGRNLSPLRDLYVRLRTLETVAPQSPGLGRETMLEMKSRLEREYRDALLNRSDAKDPIPSTLRELKGAWERARTWPLVQDGWAVLEEGLLKTYRRGRKQMKSAYDSGRPEHFHDWRKRVKDLWYHLRLLRPCWPEGLDGLVEQAHRLSEHLGDMHDVDVLDEHLRKRGDTSQEAPTEAILCGLDSRRQRLRHQAHDLARRIYVEKPEAFLRRFEGYWQQWRLEGSREKNSEGRQIASG